MFYTKFYKCKTWEVKRSKPIPKENDIWTLSNFQPARDVSTRKPIDWGVNGDRFLVLDIVLDKNNRPYHVVDNIAKTKNCMTFTLNLYEYNGKFVKTISNWGYLLGDGTEGIVYVQEGLYPVFLSNVAVKKGGSIAYRVFDGVITEIENMVYEEDVRHWHRSGKMPDKPNNIPWQLSCKFEPKPTFEAETTALLNKIIQGSPFLQSKFYQSDVFDAGRRDWPNPNQPWSFWNIVIPLDMQNLCLLDWGPKGDRYVQFDIEFEGKRNYSALKDDMYNTGKRFLFPLRLYEKDGTFVKTVSKFGNFFGFGQGSFVYIQEVNNTNTTLFTKLPIKIGSPFSYMVDKDRITKISELLNFEPAH